MKSKALRSVAAGAMFLACFFQRGVHAALIAYEGFNYPVSSTLPNQNGGTGWMGSWTGPNLGGGSIGTDVPFAVTNGLNWTNGTGYLTGVGQAIFDADDGGSNHDIGHGDARQWFDPTTDPRVIWGTNIWFSCLVRYNVVSTSGGIIVPFADGFQALSGIGVSIKGGAAGLQVYIRQHGLEMSTNTVNYLQAGGGLTNVGVVVGRFQLGPTATNPLLDPGHDRLDVWLNQTREPIGNSTLFMTDFSASRTFPFSQGYLVVRTGGNCQMTVDEIKIGTTFADVVPTTALSSNPPPAAPILSLTDAGPVGLQFIAGAGITNQYNQIVTTPNIECSWVGNATSSAPATYSFTVTNPPVLGATGFLAYMWLIAGANDFVSAENSNPNVVRLGVESDGHGDATALLGYKVNAPYDRTNFFGTGFLCGITGAPFVGTWTLSLTNDTEFRLTAPNGATASGSMPEGDSSLFSSQVRFYLGVNPRGAENLGSFMTVSVVSVVVTNAGTSIQDDFTTGAPLSTNWLILADDPASVITMSVRSVKRAEWRSAFGAGVGANSLQHANTLGVGAWTTVPPGALLGNGTNIVFITDTYTTNAAGFFRVSVPYSP